MKPRALVRAFNLLLSFDTKKKDDELEQETRELIEKINQLLKEELLAGNYSFLLGNIPQLELENPDKKIKLGIKLYSKKDLEDDLEE